MKNNRVKIVLILFMFFLLNSKDAKLSNENPDGILFKMIATINKLDCYSLILNSRERKADKSFTKGNTLLKLRKRPRALYLKMIDEGQEILWNEGDKSVLVNPNGFPFINLKLDPYASPLLDKQHHTIFDAGFDYFNSIVQKEISLFPSTVQTRISNLGNVVCEGIDCYLIAFETNDFKKYNYVAIQNESTFALSKRLNINEWLIRNNNKMSSFEIVKGKSYILTSHYAKKLILYINRSTMLPVLISIYDDVGLLEEYAYKKTVLNPAFAANEFTEDFKDYGF